MKVNQGTAVVSSALSIIGLAYAEYLATQGYDLLLIDQSRSRLNRLAETLTTRNRIAVEVVVLNRRSSVNLVSATERIEQDASIVLVINIANSQGNTLLSENQANALISGVWSDTQISSAAIKKFLSKRGVVRTYQAYVHIAAASHIQELISPF